MVLISEHIFDIKMNSGENFRSTRTIGTGTTDFLKILLTGSQAVLKEGNNSAIVFPAPRVRPKTLSDINFEVQRVFSWYSKFNCYVNCIKC